MNEYINVWAVMDSEYRKPWLVQAQDKHGAIQQYRSVAHWHNWKTGKVTAKLVREVIIHAMPTVEF